MDRPRTKAGLDLYHDNRDGMVILSDAMRTRILAIEAEAAEPAALDVERLEQIVSDIGDKMPWLLERAKGMPNESRVLAAEILARLQNPDR